MAETVTAQEITKEVCNSVRTTGQRSAIWDSELKGFGLRVSALGVKTFVIRYRVGGGRTGLERMHTIGRYGTLTPKEARRLGRLAVVAAYMLLLPVIANTLTGGRAAEWFRQLRHQP